MLIDEHWEVLALIISSPPHNYAVPQESEIARRWWVISPGSILPLNNGGKLQLIFSGHPGGSCGPDVHDAVLCLPMSLRSIINRERAERITGDVEFHVRASDWFVHQHHTDARYNRVVLHIVHICDNDGPTIRQDGQSVPICSLQDLPLVEWRSPLQPPGSVWACHRVMQRLSAEERDKLLMQAGLLRFEQKIHAFVEKLHSATSLDEHDLYDTCLIPALAEALGYGRDREFFRAAGLRLLGKAPHIPEPLGRAARPAPLDATRLRVLSRLVTQWKTPGVWITLTESISTMARSMEANGRDKIESLQIDKSGSHEQNSSPQTQSGEPDVKTSAGAQALGQLGRGDIALAIRRLRELFAILGLSSARADILICNVVLPFAAAVALLEQDSSLYERAQAIYLQYPGLSSNWITRMMSAQLLLPKEPHGTCRQQGLHFIYQQTCREKHCEICMIGKRDV